MQKKLDEVEIVFERYDFPGDETKTYPYIRRVIIHLYGSQSADSCIEVARRKIGLPNNEWNVVGFTGINY